MLRNIVDESLIDVNVICNNWQDAIKKGAYLLEKRGDVNEEYKDAIIRNFQELGPYMVISPGIVLSHSRPEDGVNNMSLSIITIEKPIEFGSELNDPVKLIITLAAKDNVSHIHIIQSLMNLLMDSKDINNLINATTKEEILNIIKKY